jgi:gliding motility-associated-like protein
MQVYDRWGELVFEQNDFLPNLTAHSWDGTFNGQALNAGVYIYKFELELLGGTTKVVMGDVTLIK